MENKTSDKNICCYTGYVSVNNRMCSPSWYETIAAGANENTEMRFDLKDLEESGITDVTEICGTITVFDADVDFIQDEDGHYKAARYVYEPFTFYPKGEENAGPGETAEMDGIVLIDNDQCKIIVDDKIVKGTHGFYTTKMYIKNKSNLGLNFAAEDVTVNGFVCDPYLSESVVVGKTSICELQWEESDFVDNGITEVDEIKMSIIGRNIEDYYSDPIVSEECVLTDCALTEE